jgi:alpha-beta hydrolase superfamily lysophospholipase
MKDKFMKAKLSKSVKWILRVLFQLVLAVVIIWFTIILLYAFQARKKDDLKLWHTVRLENEFRAKDFNEDFTFSDYQKMEDALFDEVQKKVYGAIPVADRHQFKRYNSESPSSPDNYAQNYNRSYELVPEEAAGGILLIHGLTDSPYSFKDVAELFYQKGFYVLSLRMPGHGTIPSGLATVSRKDWTAAVKVGTKRVSEFTGPDKPFYMAGFSNGALLALHYTFESIQNDRLPKPEKLLLFSPSLGVTKFAALSKWLKGLSFIPYFEKSKWKSVSPEYDPFKYTSFPLNASKQLYNLSKQTQKYLLTHQKKGTLNRLPSIITFQSVVDSTVITEDIVYKLYANLPSKGHELILFDINRNSYLRDFMNSKHGRFLSDLSRAEALSYDLTIVTNKDADSIEVTAKTKKQNSIEFESVDLGLSWPRQVYSLSHIAIVFPVDDPLYGIAPKEGSALQLGNVELRGERNLLKISAGDLLRIRCNPFFDYMMQRIEESIVKTESETEGN